MSNHNDLHDHGYAVTFNTSISFGSYAVLEQWFSALAKDRGLPDCDVIDSEDGKLILTWVDRHRYDDHFFQAVEIGRKVATAFVGVRVESVALVVDERQAAGIA